MFRGSLASLTWPKRRKEAFYSIVRKNRSDKGHEVQPLQFSNTRDPGICKYIMEGKANPSFGISIGFKIEFGINLPPH